ncbi:MAG TPA: TaqI-like C-terminal specificity domain-containing protein [Bacteroidales bacterium]|nr:TaqI-like C-terminal specificity domain-containing protein [Bacteroidales bacterium]
MNIIDLNQILASLSESKRENVFNFAFAIMEWMGIEPNGDKKPQLVAPQTQKLKDFLVPAPQTVQPQLYRLSAESQNIRIRFAVLKKIKKEYVSQLVDNDPGLMSYQAFTKNISQEIAAKGYIPSQPYYLHFVTTPQYDKLILIFNHGDQKRLVSFKNRLTTTQYNKILEKWAYIATKSKPEIVETLWKSLDIKEVNKEFYKRIKEQFDNLIEIAKTQDSLAHEEVLKQFAVRLIGRYIFCWFLKEKGIIPKELLESDTILRYKDDFSSTILTKLFFKTLNAEVSDPIRKDITTDLDDFYKSIPYLNGGLFEVHSEDYLFEKLNLNQWLISFVGVLESFDFTVDEGNSQYQHVAIDPEMLGRIFENLLASQNPETEKMANQRKAFGAFYTPREIVDYMVNESLKAHLETALFRDILKIEDTVNEPASQFNDGLFSVTKLEEPKPTPYSVANDKEAKDKEKTLSKIERLFAIDCSDNPFDKAETEVVKKALSEITVLDPACGSGAFPMGVMLRLMELRQIVGHGHRNNYDLKEEILSKNIFGVDIMPMAVEIARLRAWLSLVLESDFKPTDKKNNFGIAALPNLDFKFVCANSLIDSGYDDFAGKLSLNATLYRLDGEIQKLERIRNDYFDPKGDKAIKKQLQNEFTQTKDYIKSQISHGSLLKNYNLTDFFNKVDDWNPFDDSRPSSFFSPAWMFGIKNGFDLVIGNPPYISANNMKFEERTFFNKYKYYSSLTGKWDLYVAFIERALKLLVNKGQLIFIVPFGLLNQPFAEALRGIILNKFKLLSIVDLHNNKVFESATVPSCIPLIKNESGENYPISIFEFINDMFIKKHEINVLKYHIANQKMFRTEDLDSKTEVLNKIKNNGEKLDSFFYCSTGAEIHGKEKRNNDGSLTSGKSKFDVLYDQFRNGLMPYIEGADIKKSKEGRYSTPSIKKWLDYSEPEKMRSAKFIELFESNKIIVRRSSGLLRILAIYDERKIYTSEKCLLIIKKSDLPATHSQYSNKTPLELKYLVAIINSKLIDFYYENVYGGFIDVYPNNLKELPIIIGSKELMESIINHVDKIIKYRKEGENTEPIERQIDLLIYKLYELTYNEVKIIDPEFWLSEEEYNKIKL